SQNEVDAQLAIIERLRKRLDALQVMLYDLHSITECDWTLILPRSFFIAVLFSAKILAFSSNTSRIRLDYFINIKIVIPMPKTGIYCRSTIACLTSNGHKPKFI